MLRAKHFVTTPPQLCYHFKIHKRSYSKRYNHISCQETVINNVRGVGGESSTPVDLPPKQNEHREDKDGDHRLRDKETVPGIRKSKMKELLEKHGKEIWEKLKALTKERVGTIWKNHDFRVDAGLTEGRSKMKIWHLQANREAKSAVAKKLKNEGTHKILFRDTFDLGNAPDYDTWARSILERFR